MSDTLFSIRMRASRGGQHVSGAERLVGMNSVEVVSGELLSRALAHGKVEVDEAHCSVERIDPTTVQYRQLPDVTTFDVDDCDCGRQLAIKLLSAAGVDATIAEQAVQLLARGAAPGGEVMRGAVLMDVRNGNRLEPDPARGVRVSRMDLVEARRPEIINQLAEHGLGHHRVCEALVLAGKVMHAPGVIAELCWSDAPGYVTGYVSSPRNGYQRITRLKTPGEQTGGRVFFVDPSVAKIQDIIHYLERQPVLFDKLVGISVDEGRCFLDG